jgi:hypothetical protein
MKRFLPSFLIASAVAVIATSAVMIFRKVEPVPVKPQTKVTQLPGNTFDANASVPGTNVTFSYPSKGFYGLGADVVSSTQTAVVQSTAAYDVEKGSEFVTLTVSAGSTVASSLEDMVNVIDANSIDGQYAKLNGEYRTIGGDRFFLWRVMEDVTVWNAWMLAGKDRISARLAYKATEGAESQAAYQHNDQLFLEILERISVK